MSEPFNLQNALNDRFQQMETAVTTKIELMKLEMQHRLYIQEMQMKHHMEISELRTKIEHLSHMQKVMPATPLNTQGAQLNPVQHIQHPFQHPTYSQLGHLRMPPPAYNHHMGLHHVQFQRSPMVQTNNMSHQFQQPQPRHVPVYGQSSNVLQQS